MKTCPRCNRTYPDSENFCADDSTQLVSSPAFTQQSNADRIECPVCGGKAEPGEIICNFCGARLDQNKGAAAAPPPPTPPKPAAPTPYPRLSSAPTSVQPPPGPSPVQAPMTARMQGGIEDVKGGGSGLSIIGYAIAAIIALAAGAWFAIHLNSKSEQAAVAPSAPSIAASPATVSAPVVALANAMAVQVSGPGSTSPDRSAEVVRKAFDDNVGSLSDTYNNVLATDPKVADGMLIRLHFRPDGTVSDSAVRTSTSPDPSLDAKVVAAMANWKLPASRAGEIDADYPVIFAHDSSEEERLETELQSKVASLSPDETPEYASAPAPEASAAAAPSGVAGASPAAAASPAVALAPEAAPSTAVPPPSEVAKPHRKRPPVMASIPHPAPSLFDQVQDRLKSSPKLRRVKAYTNGSTVTLFGKVFGEEEKSFAVETVRNIPGVTSVVDNITTDESVWAQEQSTISQQLANAGLGKVTVKVIGHDAFLDGEVKTDLEKSRAVTVAEQAAPVTVRENLIRVVPGNIFGF
jgi:hypothetical protein